MEGVSIGDLYASGTANATYRMESVISLKYMTESSEPVTTSVCAGNGTEDGLLQQIIPDAKLSMKMYRHDLFMTNC